MWEQIKHWIDWAMVFTAVATLFSWLPAVASILTIVWGYYRIKEIRLDIQIKEKKLRE